MINRNLQNFIFHIACNNFEKQILPIPRDMQRLRNDDQGRNTTRNGKDTRISVLLNPRRKIKAPSPRDKKCNLYLGFHFHAKEVGWKKQRAVPPPEGSWEHKREPVSRSKERQRGNSTLYICPALRCRPVNVFKPNMDRGNWVLSLRLNLGRGVRQKWHVTRREERSRQRLGDMNGGERDGEREVDVFARWQIRVSPLLHRPTSPTQRRLFDPLASTQKGSRDFLQTRERRKFYLPRGE